MGFLKKVAGFLGLAKDELHEVKDEQIDDHNGDAVADSDFNTVESHFPRKGFSVPVQVPVERAQVGPILVPCTLGDGGVQGLGWHTKRLRIDEDGDIADEFIDEVLPEIMPSMEVHYERPMPKFEVKYNTRPVKARNPCLSRDGTIQQCVEYQGKLLLV